MILLFKQGVLYVCILIVYEFLTGVHLIDEIAESRVFFYEIASHIC